MRFIDRWFPSKNDKNGHSMSHHPLYRNMFSNDFEPICCLLSCMHVREMTTSTAAWIFYAFESDAQNLVWFSWLPVWLSEQELRKHQFWIDGCNKEHLCENLPHAECLAKAGRENPAIFNIDVDKVASPGKTPEKNKSMLLTTSILIFVWLSFFPSAWLRRNYNDRCLVGNPHYSTTVRHKYYCLDVGYLTL